MWTTKIIKGIKYYNVANSCLSISDEWIPEKVFKKRLKCYEDYIKKDWR